MQRETMTTKVEEKLLGIGMNPEAVRHTLKMLDDAVSKFDDKSRACEAIAQVFEEIHRPFGIRELRRFVRRIDPETTRRNAQTKRVPERLTRRQCQERALVMLEAGDATDILLGACSREVRPSEFHVRLSSWRG